MSLELIFGKFGSTNAEIRRRAVDGFFLKLRCSIVTAADLVSSIARARSSVDALVCFLLAEGHEGGSSSSESVGKVVTLLSEIIQMSPEAKSAYTGRVDISEITQCLFDYRDKPGCSSESIHALLTCLPEAPWKRVESVISDVTSNTTTTTEDLSQSIRSLNISSSNTCVCLQVATNAGKFRQSDRNLDDVKTIDEAVRTVLVVTSVPISSSSEQLLRSLYSIRFLMFAEVPIEALVNHPRFSSVLFSLIANGGNNVARLHEFVLTVSSVSDSPFLPIIDTVTNYLQRIAQHRFEEGHSTIAGYIDTFLEGTELLVDTAHKTMVPQQHQQQQQQSTSSCIQSAVYIIASVNRLLSVHFSNNNVYQKCLFSNENFCCKADQCRRSRLLGICSSLADLASEINVVYGFEFTPNAKKPQQMQISEKHSMALQAVVTIQRLLANFASKKCLPLFKQPRRGEYSSKPPQKHAMLASVARQLRSYVLCPAVSGHDDGGKKEAALIESAISWIEASGCDNGHLTTPIRSELATCLKQAVSARRAAELKQLLSSRDEELDESHVMELIDQSLLALPNLLQQDGNVALVRSIVTFLIEKATKNDQEAAACLVKFLSISTTCDATSQSPGVVVDALFDCITNDSFLETTLALLQNPQTALPVINVLGRTQPTKLCSFLTKLLASNSITGRTKEAFENAYACLSLFVVPIFAGQFLQQQDLTASQLFSSLVAAFLSSTTLFSESDSIALGFLSACARSSKAPALRRDGIRKLTRLVPGLTAAVTFESFASLLASIAQSPARCVQLMATTTPADTAKIDALIANLAAFATASSKACIDLASLLNEVSVLLHNPANHDRFITIGGFDLLISFLLQSESHSVSLRARAHLLVGLKWLAVGSNFARQQLFSNAKCMKTIVCLLNDSVTAGSAAALLTVLSLHRLTAVHSKACPSPQNSSSTIIIPHCFDTDFELPIDFTPCSSPSCRISVVSVPSPKSATLTMKATPAAEWARYHGKINEEEESTSDNHYWTAYEDALKWHLNFARDSTSHDRFLSAILGFELALDSGSRPNNEVMLDVVTTTLGRLLENPAQNVGGGSKTALVPLSGADCRCLTAATRLAATSLRHCESFVVASNNSFANVQLPRLCRFGVETLANLLASKQRLQLPPETTTNWESSTTAVSLVDFLVAAVRYLLNSVSSSESFAGDILQTVTELLQPDETVSLDSSTSTALVSLLLHRFTEAGLPSPPFSCPALINLLPSSQIFAELMMCGTRNLATPVALACALMPRTVATARSAVVASNRDCAIIALSLCEQNGRLFESLIDSFIAACTPISLVAASRLVQLACRCPNPDLIKNVIIKRLIAGNGQDAATLKLRSSATCLLTACISLLSRRDFDVKTESEPLSICNHLAFHMCPSDMEQLLRSASTVTISAVSDMKIDPNSSQANDLVVFASSLASLVSAFLVSSKKTELDITSNWIDSIIASLVNFLPEKVESDRLGRLLGSTLLPTLTKLLSHTACGGKWPSGLSSSLRILSSLVARQLLTCHSSELCLALCHFYCCIMAGDLLEPSKNNKTLLSTAILLVVEFAPLDAIVTLLLESNTLSSRQIGAVTLQLLCEAAMHCDAATRRRLVASLLFVTKHGENYDDEMTPPSSVGGSSEALSLSSWPDKLEELVLVGSLVTTPKQQSTNVTVDCVRAVTRVVALVSHGGDNNSNQIKTASYHLVRSLFEAVRIWQRIVSLAKRIQSSILSLSCDPSTTTVPNDLHAFVFEELGALMDLLTTCCSALATTSSDETLSNSLSSTSSCNAATILPVLCTTLLTVASNLSSTVDRTNVSRLANCNVLVKQRPFAAVAAVSCLKLARTLVAAQSGVTPPQIGAIVSQVVPQQDLLQLAETVARFMPDLISNNNNMANNKSAKQLCSSALDLLCTVVASSPRGLGRVFCTRLPQRMATRLLTSVPTMANGPSGSSGSKRRSSPVVDFTHFYGIIDERLALLRLLKSAAVLWPAGHHLVLADASESYLPLLNDWAGSERDVEALEVLQLLARRGKTARRLGLQQTASPVQQKRVTPPPNF